MRNLRIAHLSILFASQPTRRNSGPGWRSHDARAFISSGSLGYVVGFSLGCSSVSQRAEERRPFFQPELEVTTHGRKTLFDRIVELDPGGLNVKVARDYQATHR